MRAGVVSVALVLPAVSLQLVVGACGSDDRGDGSDDDSMGESTSSTGVGGVDADATVPDGQPDVKPSTFVELCGQGDCVPGRPDSCDSGGAPRGCQVVADEYGEPYPECRSAGEGVTDAPCQAPADCVPGHACVPTEGSRNDVSSGVCRPYCCGDVETCPPEKSFCAPRPLIGSEGVLEVPVCVPVAPCELLSAGVCTPGTICGVVRTDGTTSCVEPGSGTLCEACPCADGLVCAQHAGLCQRLCHTDGTADECGAGFCQGGSPDYPPGIGVCVGAENTCE